MTKKDFFRVLIKVFGLYSLIIALFTVLPTNIPFFLTMTEFKDINWIICLFAVTIFLYSSLLFFTDKIINWLHLDRGFESDTIQFENLNPKSIVMLASIIIGGFLFINNFPSFIGHCIFYVKTNNIGEPYGISEKLSWATTGFNLILGYFLVVNYEYVPRLLRVKGKID